MRILPAIVLACSVLVLTACSERGFFERAGERADEAVDDAGDAVGDAADEATEDLDDER